MVLHNLIPGKTGKAIAAIVILVAAVITVTYNLLSWADDNFENKEGAAQSHSQIRAYHEVDYSEARLREIELELQDLEIRQREGEEGLEGRIRRTQVRWDEQLKTVESNKKILKEVTQD